MTNRCHNYIINYSLYEGKVKSSRPSLRETSDKRLLGWNPDKSWCHRHTMVSCYVRSIALYGSDTWTLRKLERKYLESFEIWCWRRMEKLKWSDKVTYVVLEHIEKKRTLLNNIYSEKSIGWVIF